MTLASKFGSLGSIVKASQAELAQCPGEGSSDSNVPRALALLPFHS